MNFLKTFLFKYFKLVNFIIFLVNRVKFQDINIKGVIRVVNRGNITIGSNVKFNSGQRFNPIGGDSRVNLVTTSTGDINIGDNTGLSNCTLFSSSSIFIGENVKIGGGVKIYDTDFHSTDYIHRRNGKLDSRNAVSKGVHIHDDVFIGSHSIVLKGVTIGQSSIIGAGSVVTKNVPSLQVWGGNPAKFIKNLPHIKC